MKYRISVIIPLLLVMLSALNSCRGSVAPPRAAGGVLDVSAWDFGSGGTVRLDGEWEFYWRQLLTPADFRKSKTIPPSAMAGIPGTWDHYSVGDSRLPGEGFATYRLLIKLPPGEKKYAIKMKDAGTAYRLWANGLPVLSSGVPGISRETMVPQFLPATACSISANGELELVIQVSNFFDKKGGIWHSIILGLGNQITSLREWSVAVESLLFGVLMIMAVYHLGLFALRRSDYSALFFSAYCVIIAARTIVTGERLLVRAFPDINWELELKLEHITLYLGVPVFLLFFRSLYQNEIFRTFARAVLTVGALFTAILLFTPARIHTQLIPPFQLVTLTSILYVLAALILAAVRKREGALFMIGGFIIISATVINDILYDHGLINTGYIVSWGVLAFIVFQSFVVSMRFSRGFSQAESLSEELMTANTRIAEYNANLEQKVRDRTKKILEQKEYLEEQVSIAERLQKTLLPASPPVIDKLAIGFSYKPVIGIGGDFLEFRTRGEAGLGIFICDVSGHGMVGALIASMVKMSLNQWDESLENPAKTLASIHDSLKGKLGHNFITACACYIDLATGTVKLASAGHPPLIIIRENGELERIKPRGRVITDIFASTFDESEFLIMPGDKVVLYTDGIIEARNTAGDLFEERRFEDFLRVSGKLTPQNLCDEVILKVNEFILGSPGLDDDITIIIAEYTASPDSE